MLDIRRVYPENGFFKDKDLQEMMLRILFIYAREHEHILYKQVRLSHTQHSKWWRLTRARCVGAV